MAAQGFYNNVVTVHPTNRDIAFFGGVNLTRTDNAGAFRRTIEFRHFL